MAIDVSPFLTTREAVCPENLIELAKKQTAARVAIARATSVAALVAAKDAVEAGIMIPIFTGEKTTINERAQELGWDISAFEMIDCKGEEAAGLAAAQACGEGRADVLMKGHLHTDVFMKSALNREIGLRTGNRLVHIFHISHPDSGRPLLVSDAAVNVTPNLETRQVSMTSMVKILHLLGCERPKIAILSATESPIPTVPSSIEAKELQDWGRQNIKNADITGPLALDLILSPQSATIKGMAGDAVAGQADGIVVPDIVSGNALFKALVYLCGGCAAGVVMGAKVPILLTSRADPPAARLASAALATIISGNA